MKRGKFYILEGSFNSVPFTRRATECYGYIDEENQIAYNKDPFGRWIATDMQSGLAVTPTFNYATRKACMEAIACLMEKIKTKRDEANYLNQIRTLQILIEHGEPMTTTEILAQLKAA